ncbi:hypothetical protein ES703_53351 [subsurface metagenome]
MKARMVEGRAPVRAVNIIRAKNIMKKRVKTAAFSLDLNRSKERPNKRPAITDTWRPETAMTWMVAACCKACSTLKRWP